jgi:hypothetical protein
MTMPKLSRLQRFIMVALSSDEATGWTCRDLRKFVYEHYVGFDGTALPSARASLSRSLSRLEQWGFIERIKGSWRLSNHTDYATSGWLSVLAVLRKICTGKQDLGSGVPLTFDKELAKKFPTFF